MKISKKTTNQVLKGIRENLMEVLQEVIPGPDPSGDIQGVIDAIRLKVFYAQAIDELLKDDILQVEVQRREKEDRERILQEIEQKKIAAKEKAERPERPERPVPLVLEQRRGSIRRSKT